MSKKRILIFTDWYEPGYKAGGPIRSVRNFVDAMVDIYEISVLTSDRDFNEIQSYGGIETNEWLEKLPGISIYYADPKSINSKLILSLIREKKPDFIYLNSLYSYRFSIIPLLLRWKNSISAKIILSPRGMLQKGAMEMKPLKKRLYIRLLNTVGLPAKIDFHATDSQEAEDILEHFPKAKSVTEIFNFPSAETKNLQHVEKIPGHLRLVYISRITPKKNLNEFLQWLTVIPEQIRLDFEIYGEKEDEQYWEETLALIKKLPAHIHVHYGGSLPHEEVNHALVVNHIFVLPTRGENYGHAIAEAFSAGRPVMTSDKTPWRSLKQEKIGWDLSLDNQKGWTDAILEAAAFDQATYNEWSSNCRVYALKQLNKVDLKTEYQKLFS